MDGASLLTGSKAGKVAGAILFMQAAALSMDVFSAVNSSPWTAENFGGDPEKAKTCREYVHHGLALSTGLSVGAAVVAESWAPVIGMVAANGYMFWLYERALKRGVDKASTGWAGPSVSATVSAAA